MGFLLTRAAQDDMLAIGRITQQSWGKKQRVIYLASLDKAFCLLGENPNIGIECSEIRSGYRKHPCQKHVIYYKEKDRDILIVRILHSAMDAIRHLPKEDVK